MSSSNPNYASIDGYRHISTVVGRTKAMMDKIRSGDLKPLLTTSKKEEEFIGGIYPSDQKVIAARTGVGKTAIALHNIKDYCNKTINPFYEGKIIILFDSYEMADWRGVLRLISREGQVSVKDLLDYHKRLSEERYLALKHIADNLSHLPIYVSTVPLKVDDWVEKKKQVQAQFPKHHIVNLMDHTRLIAKGEEAKEEERITRLMIAGIGLKNNFDMFNIFLSQMNRNIETNIQRDKLGTHLPVSSDIFGSDAVFQCADIVEAYHRPGMYGIEKFNDIPTGIDVNNPDVNDNLLIRVILKNRDGWTGTLTMKHNIGHNHIEDLNMTEALATKKQSIQPTFEDF
jgi:replicative DNA helicase